MSSTRKAKKASKEETEFTDLSDELWGKFEDKLKDWVKSTLPDLVKEYIQSHAARIVDEYVSSEKFKQSLAECLNFDASELMDRVTAAEEKVNNLTEIDMNITELEDKYSQLSAELDNLEQYTRRTNIRLYGIPENEEENTDVLAMNFFKDELNVPVAKEDISRSHRIGRKSSPTSGRKPRPIIVRLARHNTKVELLTRRRLLKEKRRPFNIQEDLTLSRRKILTYLSQDIEEGIISKVWTIDGTIFLRPSSHSSTIERCTTMKQCQAIVAKYS